MVKRNSKRKQSTARRRRLVPRPVKGKGTPLPAETGWRLAFKLAQARGERLLETEGRLERHHQGRRKGKVMIKGHEFTRDQLRPQVRARVEAMYEQHVKQHGREPAMTAIHEAVGKSYGKSRGWVWRLLDPRRR